MEENGSSRMDVVLSCSSTMELGAFLEAWKPILSPYHLLIIVPNNSVKVPSGFLHHLYTHQDIRDTLRDSKLASSLTISHNTCRSFGFLVSKKQFIFTLDTSCFPAKDPATGDIINPIDRHLQNLTQPSTPLFFNTLYDPYREGTDFVRGYPFSWREGVASAVSHGLWLNMPDMDAPTRIVKPSAANNTYVDAVVTVPKDSLFPMSSINLAFDRKRVGVTMFFGLQTLAASSRYGSLDDIWSGLCCKVICDHLGYGVKSGLPYIWRNETSTVSVIQGLQQSPQGLHYLEQLLPFFQTLHFSKSAISAEDCYREIAQQLKEGKLNSVDALFQDIGSLMESWLRVWHAVSD